MQLKPANFYNNIQSLQPVQWNRISTDDERVFFAPFELQHDLFGKLNVGIREYNDGCSRWIIEIKNKLDKVFGKEILTINNDPQKSMYGYDIVVEPEYRKTKSRFGEILRIFSVMLMNENKSNNFGICSKASAVDFHSKYKFEPRAKELPKDENGKINSSVDMVLTRENLIENHEFYNNLFKQYGIDYAIGK